MATYKLKLDVRNSIAKALLEYIFQLSKSSKAIEIENEVNKPNLTTQTSFKQKKNPVKRTNSDDILKDILNS
jgi:hypothetical protein